MALPILDIGGLKAKLPIVQGGMGVGVSLSRLAAAVANEGGVGTISGVQIGYRDKDFALDPVKANLRAIGQEMEKARELSPAGIIGMNFMTVMHHYEDYVREAVKNGVDFIVSGAGLPLSLPKFVEGSTTRIIPIVSSARACKLIINSWLRHSDRLPDAVVVEGPKAGGHLGFKMQELLDGTFQTLEDALTDVLALVHGFEEKFQAKIPVIAGGGVTTAEDVRHILNLGASGVQIGTRFVATEECDVCGSFKQAYIDAKPEDVQIILSPCGLPARAVRTPFVKQAYASEDSRIPPKRCYHCMDFCYQGKTRFCISQSLFDSACGNGGLVFCGAEVGKIQKITTVAKLMRELTETV